MWIVDLLLRIAVLAGCWLVLSEGRWDYSAYGVICVMLAAAVSVWLSPLRSLRLSGIARAGSVVVLVVWSLGKMLSGAVDVTRRAFGPSRLVQPQELDLPALLPPLRGGVLSAALFNLLPGTLVYRLEEDSIAMHALSGELDAAAGWEALNRRVGAVYGQRVVT